MRSALRAIFIGARHVRSPVLPHGGVCRQQSPRPSRERLQETFIAMMEGVREQALLVGLIDQRTWEKGIADLYRATATLVSRPLRFGNPGANISSWFLQCKDGGVEEFKFIFVDTTSAGEYQQLCARLYRISLPFSRAHTSKSARRQPCQNPSVQFPRAITM